MNMEIAFKKPNIDAMLSLFPEGLVGFDIESTGLSPLTEKIIELAAIKITPTGEVHIYEQLINPEKPIPENTIKIHKVEDSMVADSPVFKEVSQDFWEFCGDYPLLAHNGHFDASFLINEMFHLNQEPPPLKLYDTCVLTKSITKILKKEKLDHPQNQRVQVLWDFFKMPPMNLHRALNDTFAMLTILYKMIQLTHGMNIQKSKLLELKEKSLLYCLDYLGTQPKLAIPKKFHELIPHLKKDKKIFIVYKKGRFKGKERPVEPTALLPALKGPVLLAKCLIDNIQKKFLLENIERFDLNL